MISGILEGMEVSLLRVNWFFAGLLVGIILSASSVAAAGFQLMNSGISVSLSASALAGGIGDEFRAELTREIPTVTAEIKKGLPERVRRDMAESLEGLSITISGYRVTLPEGIINQLEDELSQRVVESLNESFDEFDYQPFIEETSRRAERMILERMIGGLNGQTLMVPILGDYQVPVTIRLEP